MKQYCIKNNLQLYLRSFGEKASQLSSSILTFKNFVAGGVETAVAAIKSCSTVHGGIVTKTACTDPTPGSANQYIQAVGNYRGVINISPATYFQLYFIPDNLKVIGWTKCTL